jgi:hypothetical protein
VVVVVAVVMVVMVIARPSRGDEGGERHSRSARVGDNRQAVEHRNVVPRIEFSRRRGRGVSRDEQR